ncbi:hypothetical protein JHW43_008635 [Diplocarpon mali]|nr:hypothetical protein JHW43_008635 [Diplocarpon mali]
MFFPSAPRAPEGIQISRFLRGGGGNPAICTAEEGRHLAVKPPTSVCRKRLARFGLTSVCRLGGVDLENLLLGAAEVCIQPANIRASPAGGPRYTAPGPAPSGSVHRTRHWALGTRRWALGTPALSNSALSNSALSISALSTQHPALSTQAPSPLLRPGVGQPESGPDRQLDCGDLSISVSVPYGAQEHCSNLKIPCCPDHSTLDRAPDLYRPGSSPGWT